jgi:hypothetical protein
MRHISPRGAVRAHCCRATPSPTCGRCQFTDGEWDLAAQAPDSLYDTLLEWSGVAVALLAFAPRGGWLVKWEDGNSLWEGLPWDLEHQLDARRHMMGGPPDVEFLSCGPEGEWFVRFADGRWDHGGVPDGCAFSMSRLHEQECDVLQVLFGDYGAWGIVYSY